MSVVLGVEATPNPYANVFRLRQARPGVGVSFYSAEEAAAEPLAARLFAVPGVRAVFWVSDRVTVARSPKTPLEPWRTEVIAALEAALV